MGQLKVLISNGEGARNAPLELPDDVPAYRLLSTIVTKLNLPAKDPQGNLIDYTITHSRTGRILKNSDTLSSVGIEDNDTLALAPHIIIAGKARSERGTAAAEGAVIASENGSAHHEESIGVATLKLDELPPQEGEAAEPTPVEALSAASEPLAPLEISPTEGLATETAKLESPLGLSGEQPAEPSEGAPLLSTPAPEPPPAPPSQPAGLGYQPAAASPLPTRPVQLPPAPEKLPTRPVRLPAADTPSLTARTSPRDQPAPPRRARRRSSPMLTGNVPAESLQRLEEYRADETRWRMLTWVFVGAIFGLVISWATADPLVTPARASIGFLIVFALMAMVAWYMGRDYSRRAEDLKDNLVEDQAQR